MKFFEPAKTGRKKPQGLIAIVALIMVGLMAIILIDLQMTMMDTYNSIKSSDNYLSARVTADSIMELVQYKLKGYEVGLNSGEIVCGYGKFAPAGGNPAFCNDAQLSFLTTPDQGKAQKDIKITVSVKGRNNAGEKITTGKCGDVGNDNCYVVPFPGTGDAGDEEYCKIYKPDFNDGQDDVNNVADNLANGANNLDQLNYGCNWNKLRFGSTMTDRVAIPLYYDSAGLGEASGSDTIVNVFNEDTNDSDVKANNILVRLRTPCIPCGPLRACDDTVKDETVCNDNERYVLDDGGDGKITNKKNDIVVQWLINGECGEGGGKLGFCGVIPIGDKKQDVNVISAFYESKINKAKDDGDYILIYNGTITYDTNGYPDLAALLSSDDYPIKLPLMSKPILTLFLSKPLLTADKDRVPYLEYQVLTDKPISSNESVIEVNVVVDTNGFTRTITKDVPKPLIDFAIQNN